MQEQNEAAPKVKQEKAKIQGLGINRSATAMFGVLGALVFACAMDALMPHQYEGTQVFPRENGKPSVMRLYRKSGADSLLVQDTNTHKFIMKDEYLKRITNAAERAREEESIKTSARWYEE